MGREKTVFLVVLLFVLIFNGVSVKHALAMEVDHRLLSTFLEKAVIDGKVNYQVLKKRESLLDRYLDRLAAVRTADLSANERLAFYVNAYNAWTIRLILWDYPGVKSIKELGSFFQSPWKKKICRIDGELISLDTLEHEILRPEFKDPRIHFAVNCASKGCPPLRDKAYTGEQIGAQLSEMTAGFLNNPENYSLRGDTLYVSKIFKWYRSDFQPDILSFILKYAHGDLKKNLAASRETVKIMYLDYDWSLNEQE